jgi:hypothetical protein
MLDVHPPHEPIHGWRDFLLHIATITIGLLIALALEAGVEAIHHHHIVHQARENIRQEIVANQQILNEDRRSLAASTAKLNQDLVILHQIEAQATTHPVIHSGPPAIAHVDESKFDLIHWGWNSPQAAAFQASRDNGALALMSYDDAHGFSLVYNQQEDVNTEATIYIEHHHAAAIPLGINPDIAALSPSQLDEVTHGIATTLADIQYLEQLMDGLDENYRNVLHDLYPQ